MQVSVVNLFFTFLFSWFLKTGSGQNNYCYIRNINTKNVSFSKWQMPVKEGSKSLTSMLLFLASTAPLPASTSSLPAFTVSLGLSCSLLSLGLSSSSTCHFCFSSGLNCYSVCHFCFSSCLNCSSSCCLSASLLQLIALLSTLPPPILLLFRPQLLLILLLLFLSRHYCTAPLSFLFLSSFFCSTLYAFLQILLLSASISTLPSSIAPHTASFFVHP
jgi:hypothetical protein